MGTLEDLRRGKSEAIQVSHFPQGVTIFDLGVHNGPTTPAEFSEHTIISTNLSSRLRRAGGALQRARERHNVSRSNIGLKFSQNTAAIEGFENGTQQLSLPRLLNAAQMFIDEEDRDIVELNRLTEEEQWIQTVTYPGMTFPRVIQLLRLNQLQTKEDFSHNSGVSVKQLQRAEKGQKPRPSSLNLIIEASGLDPNGLPAQLIRLLEENRLPMELSKLRTCTFGELYQYLRQLRGFSAADAGKQLTPRQHAGSILHMEKSTTVNNPEGKNRLVDMLSIDPRSALAEIIQVKILTPEKPISEELLERVYTGEYDGQFIFAENVQEAEVTRESTPTGLLNDLEKIRRQLMRSGDSEIILGGLLKHLRERQRLTKVDSAQHITPDQIRHVEKGQFPLDQTLMRILKGIGYDIHNPITWYILKIVDML